MPLDKEQIVAELKKVKDPELFKDVITLNQVKEIRLDGSDVLIRLQTAQANPQSRQAVEQNIRAVIAPLGATSVRVEYVQAATSPTAAPRTTPLPMVKQVIAVGAGKGGVGKSTMALNLAIGLQRAGLRVGVMDGDIYGPSMPTLLGIKGVQPQGRGKKIIPFAVHGIHAITIGSLVESDKPLIWRGPMAHGAFKQLLIDNTDWPELDMLIIDLPPGTGDIAISLCQLLPLTGVVIVATPQQVALDDAIRAVNMFKQLEVPVLGLIENMSYLAMPDGSVVDIFGRGGTAKAAQELGLPLLGAVPLFTELRQNSDAGTPIANYTGNPQLRDSLEAVVRTLQGELHKRSTASAGPTLNIS